MKCIYHNDLDGHCSGAIIKMEYPEAEMIEMNYDREFPWDKITDKEETIFMVDFSLDVDGMKKLDGMSNFIWIDHHVGIIEQLEKAGVKIDGLQDASETLAGCELVWKYIVGSDVPVPYAVRLCGRYDMFDFRDPNVLPFHLVLESYEHDPGVDMTIWEELLEDNSSEFSLDPVPKADIDNFLEEGRVILRYIDASNRVTAVNNAFYVDFEGHRFLAINSSNSDTRVFQSIQDREKHEAFMIFSFNGNEWKFGMYHGGWEDSPVVCHKIAEKFGGGGHAASSGFEVKKIPFDLSKVTRYKDTI